MKKFFKSMLVAIFPVMYLLVSVYMITGYRVVFWEFIILYVPFSILDRMHTDYHRKLFKQY